MQEKKFPFSQLVIATSNPHKLEEIQASFRKIYSNHLEIEFISLASFPTENQEVSNLDLVEETGTSFDENARLKAKHIFLEYKLPVLADDSGLVVPALGHEPGIHSRRYAGEHATDQENNHKLIQKLVKNNLFSSRRDGVEAFFVSRVVLHFEHDQNLEIFSGEGICRGFITQAPHGVNGFGYDPHFAPASNNPEKLTFAQMTMKGKGSYSHRHLALVNLAAKISK